MKDYIRCRLKASIEVKQSIMENNTLINMISQASEAIIKCYQGNGKVLVAGNGGSAADAQHFAGELVNRFNFDRKGLPCIALSTDSSVITAVSNDFSYSKIFWKQIEALGCRGDVFIGISTSGNSANIVEAMQLCREIGITTIGLTGEMNGKIDNLCDCLIKVPSDKTPLTQEAHLTIEHIICGIVESAIFNNKLSI